MRIGQFDLRVLVRGNPIREYPHTDGNTYVEGWKGSEYELQFENITGGNVLLVASVDGLSIMDGKPASAESGGYVVGMYQKLKIPGWRLDNDGVAKFAFGERKSSYSSQIGQDPANIGVIGAMVYREKRRPIRPLAVSRGVSPSHDFNLLGGATKGMGGGGWPGSGEPRATYGRAEPEIMNMGDEGFSLGTGFGDRAAHRVREVQFEKSDDAPTLLAIYYDGRKGLERLGIRLEPEQRTPVGRPNPFPAGVGCVPPAGWRG